MFFVVSRMLEEHFFLSEAHLTFMNYKQLDGIFFIAETVIEIIIDFFLSYFSIVFM